MTVFWYIFVFLIGGWIGMTIAAVFGLFRDMRELVFIREQTSEIKRWLEDYCASQDEYIKQLELEIRNLCFTARNGN